MQNNRKNQAPSQDEEQLFCEISDALKELDQTLAAPILQEQHQETLQICPAKTLDHPRHPNKPRPKTITDQPTSKNKVV